MNLAWLTFAYIELQESVSLRLQITIFDVICTGLKTSKGLQILASSHFSHISCSWFHVDSAWHRCRYAISTQSQFWSSFYWYQYRVYCWIYLNVNSCQASYVITTVPKKDHVQTFDLFDLHLFIQYGLWYNLCIETLHYSEELTENL